jgi:hypothetical protein
MAYDRYDPRDERSRWRGDRDPDRGPGEERGFFERAGDEVASWFGDEEAERRRREDQRMEERYGRDEDRGRYFGRDRDRFNRSRFDRDEDRNLFSRSSYRGTGGEGHSSRAWSGPEPSDRGYSQSGGVFAAGGAPRGGFEHEYRGNTWQAREPQVFDETRRSAYFTGDRGRNLDPHYHSWRQRQLDELDRDYDDYRRENQARFEDDFGDWRQRRQQKRSLLGQMREHMEVIGSDGEHVGAIDRLAGDRIILAKSDPESGGVHHSLSCADVDRIEGDRVVLDCSADEARSRWRDESRERALFEREDQGEMGDRILDRSFEGTYR